MSEKTTGALGFTATFAALMVLAVGSFGLSYISLGAWSTPIAIAIAAVKAGLVIAVFMELAESRATTRIVALAGVVMLVLLASLVSVDVLTRSQPPMVPPRVGR